MPLRTSEVAPRTQQPVDVALAVWEQAVRENKPVGLDSQGNITVLFGASIDGFSGRASNRQAAKDVLLARVRSEKKASYDITSPKKQRRSADYAADDGNLLQCERAS